MQPASVFVYATYPIYLFGTDVKVMDLEVRINACGDNRSMWDVQYCGADDKWREAPTDHARAILKHIEQADPNTWGEILVAA